MSKLIVEFFARLGFHERIAFASLGGILSLAFIIIWVVLPFVERRDEAYRAMTNLRDERDWLAQIQLDYAEIAARENSPTEEKSELMGLSAIETSLRASGLRETIAELGTTAEDEISLRLRRVEFVRLMPWLQSIERDTGYSVIRLELFQGEKPGEVVAGIQMK